jgi:hypothetical protein
MGTLVTTGRRPERVPNATSWLGCEDSRPVAVGDLLIGSVWWLMLEWRTALTIIFGGRLRFIINLPTGKHFMRRWAAIQGQANSSAISELDSEMRRPGMQFAAILLVVCLSPISSAQQPARSKSKKMPAMILLVRHAEKPADEENSPHLSALGKKRAAALPELFRGTKQRPSPLPLPDLIFAAKSSKNSQRPVETVALLAQQLRLPVIADYDDETDVDRLVTDLLNDPRYAGKKILICWRHDSLADLAHKLGASDAPDSWKKDVFDRVWQLDYSKDGKVTFQDRPQLLLSGDSE